MLERRRVDIGCVRETQYKGEGCTVFGEGEEGYKYLWMGEDKRGGVGILIRKELEKKMVIVEVNRISTRIIKIKLILGENLMHVISAYATQQGKMQEKKKGVLDDDG